VLHTIRTRSATTGSTSRSTTAHQLAAVGNQERVARLLDVAGLELEALFGSADREPHDDDSREYVFVARR
jgi:hypothetical protein